MSLPSSLVALVTQSPFFQPPLYVEGQKKLSRLRHFGAGLAEDELLVGTLAVYGI